MGISKYPRLDIKYVVNYHKYIVYLLFDKYALDIL